MQNTRKTILTLLRAYFNGGAQPTESAAASGEPSAAVISALLQNYIGADVEAYGGESVMLQYVDKQTLSARTSILMSAHPIEGPYVLDAAKKKYPIIGAQL